MKKLLALILAFASLFSLTSCLALDEEIGTAIKDAIVDSLTEDEKDDDTEKVGNLIDIENLDLNDPRLYEPMSAGITRPWDIPKPKKSSTDILSSPVLMSDPSLSQFTKMAFWGPKRIFELDEVEIKIYFGVYDYRLSNINNITPDPLARITVTVNGETKEVKDYPGFKESVQTARVATQGLCVMDYSWFSYSESIKIPSEYFLKPYENFRNMAGTIVYSLSYLDVDESDGDSRLISDGTRIVLDYYLVDGKVVIYDYRVEA